MNPLNHVAIIMDGNGRWGLKYKNSRNAGHKEGLKTVERIIKVSLKTFTETKSKKFVLYNLLRILFKSTSVTLSLIDTPLNI